MPKKMGVNTKAEEARARRSAAEADRKERETKEKEEKYWRDAEGSKSRASKKREDDAEKRAEAAARRAETRRIAEQEQRDLEAAGRRPDQKASRVSIPVPKVTEAQLQRRREEEQQRILQTSEVAKKRQSRTADEEEYHRIVMVENTNRDDSIIEAHNVDEAIAKMVLSEPALPADRHPERRLKASFKTEIVVYCTGRLTCKMASCRRSQDFRIEASSAMRKSGVLFTGLTELHLKKLELRGSKGHFQIRKLENNPTQPAEARAAGILEILHDSSSHWKCTGSSSRPCGFGKLEASGDRNEAFEEEELPKLKEEKPGLTFNQYRDMIWKLWKKSPDNPLNQTGVAGAAD
ncbi:hypothetical protein ZIOFF_041699 [Zingiber officinale]|uniref:Coiled-coil domain-containing protein n=1 Tax=Zingiber officinale TaxID=94328 RepID=A0A8J5G823_ZINOF|nr:hypothetical protein ZIOFF_041699 [Zingiber officinale]